MKPGGIAAAVAVGCARRRARCGRTDRYTSLTMIHTFQSLIFALQKYWSDQGCVVPDSIGDP